MTIEMEGAVAYYRRKENQAWELAGCARVDRDTEDELRWTAEAREYARLLSEALRESKIERTL